MKSKMFKNKEIIIAIVMVYIIAIPRVALANNSNWSAQSISNFISNCIDAPDVLRDDKYVENIKREEFAQLIVAMCAKSSNIKKEDITLQENPFIDTNSIDVQRAYSLGIINGKSKDKFHPQENVTREEIATMITRFLNIKKININSKNDLNGFKDKKDISSWAFNSMAYCVDTGVIKGFQNELQPKQPASVEQVITMLDRIAINNNWLNKSKDIYVNSFLIPYDTKLSYELYANNSFELRIRWDDIDDIEKLKKDLKYMFNSKFNQNEIEINRVIENIIKSKNHSDTEFYFKEEIIMHNYLITVRGDKYNAFIFIEPPK